jgi:hypothetical protein
VWMKVRSFTCSGIAKKEKTIDLEGACEETLVSRDSSIR